MAEIKTYGDISKLLTEAKSEIEDSIFIDSRPKRVKNNRQVTKKLKAIIAALEKSEKKETI